jgi:hypothetical protein
LETSINAAPADQQSTITNFLNTCKQVVAGIQTMAPMGSAPLTPEAINAQYYQLDNLQKKAQRYIDQIKSGTLVSAVVPISSPIGPEAGASFPGLPPTQSIPDVNIKAIVAVFILALAALFFLRKKKKP